MYARAHGAHAVQEVRGRRRRPSRGRCVQERRCRWCRIASLLAAPPLLSWRQSSDPVSGEMLREQFARGEDGH